ncbi:unnamed protein product [Rhizoctonia solani]
MHLYPVNPILGPGKYWTPQGGAPPGISPRTESLLGPPANTAPKAPKHRERSIKRLDILFMWYVAAGDREHISEPDRSESIFEISNEYLGRLKQNMPPQKRTEVIKCRLNVLFDVLNCETILRVIEKLLTLSQAMQGHDVQNAI